MLLKSKEGNAASSINKDFGKDRSISNLMSASLIKNFHVSSASPSLSPYLISLMVIVLSTMLTFGSDISLSVE